jgi:hypothetical protein
MRTIISQSVVLPAPAESLFAMYTDPAKHSAITGAPVAISIERVRHSKPSMARSPVQRSRSSLNGS